MKVCNNRKCKHHDHQTGCHNSQYCEYWVYIEQCNVINEKVEFLLDITPDENYIVNCANCTYFYEQHYECRRKAPGMEFHKFPSVQIHEWCGEGKLKIL